MWFSWVVWLGRVSPARRSTSREDRTKGAFPSPSLVAGRSGKVRGRRGGDAWSAWLVPSPSSNRRPVSGRRRARGAMAMLPLLAGYVPFALVIGATAAELGSPLAGWAGSWLIYGGSVHLAALRTLDGAGAVMAITDRTPDQRPPARLQLVAGAPLDSTADVVPIRRRRDDHRPHVGRSRRTRRASAATLASNAATSSPPASRSASDGPPRSPSEQCSAPVSTGSSSTSSSRCA